MSEEKREAEYLRKAKQAQEHAITAREPSCKDGWRKVAEGYRKLASDPRC